MVLATAVALLALAPPQQRIDSEQRAIEIAIAFREFAILGVNGSNVGDPLEPYVSSHLDESRRRFEIEFVDGFVRVRKADGRVAAHFLQDKRNTTRSMKEPVSEQAIARAQAKVNRALAFLGYTGMTAVFGKTTVGSGSEALHVSFRPVWRGIEYPSSEWRHATFDPEGERLLVFNLGGLSRPPEDTAVTVLKAEAGRTMLAKLNEVLGSGPWELTRLEPVIFRVRPDRTPHISEFHSWGWETGPPSIMAWEGVFVNSSVPQRPGDPPWTVHAWLDAKTGAMLEMLSVTHRSSTTWRPPK